MFGAAYRRCDLRYGGKGQEDSPSNRVDFLDWDLELLDRVDCLGSKSFVAIKALSAANPKGRTELGTYISKKSTSSCVMPAFCRTAGIA
jgi:hypothetical protein